MASGSNVYRMEIMIRKVITGLYLFILLNILSSSVFGIPEIKSLENKFEFADKVVVMLGQLSTSWLDKKNHILPEGSPYTKRIRAISKNHLSEDGLNIDIQVYSSEKVNAFALPNGSIRFYSGLLDLLDDDELRFVLGHEIGHVKKKHSLKKMVVSYGLGYVKKLAKNSGMVKAISEAELAEKTELYLNSKFSQWEELQADKYSFHFLVKNDYPLSATVSIFDDFEKLEKKHSIYSSHPPSMKRRLQMITLHNQHATQMEK